MRGLCEFRSQFQIAALSHRAVTNTNLGWPEDRTNSYQLSIHEYPLLFHNDSDQKPAWETARMHSVMHENHGPGRRWRRSFAERDCWPVERLCRGGTCRTNGSSTLRSTENGAQSSPSISWILESIVVAVHLATISRHWEAYVSLRNASSGYLNQLFVEVLKVAIFRGSLIFLLKYGIRDISLAFPPLSTISLLPPSFSSVFIPKEARCSTVGICRVHTTPGSWFGFPAKAHQACHPSEIGESVPDWLVHLLATANHCTGWIRT